MRGFKERRCPVHDTEVLNRGFMSKELQKQRTFLACFCSPYLLAEQLSLPEAAAAGTGQAASCHSGANGYISCAGRHALVRLTQ